MKNIPVPDILGGKRHFPAAPYGPRRCYREVPSHCKVPGDTMSTEGTESGQDDQPDAAARKGGSAARPHTDPKVATAEETEDVEDTPVDTTEPS